MSSPFLIIDGYNLLHAAGFARLQYGPGDLERARRRLVVLLAEKLRADERPRCTVVFDAQQAAGDRPQQADHHGITVQFAPAGQDADTAIERLIAHHPAARRMIVVSSDHRLQQAAKRRQATPLDSETFLKELDRRETISPLIEQQAGAAPAGPPSRPASSEDDWLRIFSGIDVRELAAEISREPLDQAKTIDPEAARLEALQRQLDDPDFLNRWLEESP
jgi:uncharacterized protein